MKCSLEWNVASKPERRKRGSVDSPSSFCPSFLSPFHFMTTIYEEKWPRENKEELTDPLSLFRWETTRESDEGASLVSIFFPIILPSFLPEGDGNASHLIFPWIRRICLIAHISCCLYSSYSVFFLLVRCFVSLVSPTLVVYPGILVRLQKEQNGMQMLEDLGMRPGYWGRRVTKRDRGNEWHETQQDVLPFPDRKESSCCPNGNTCLPFLLSSKSDRKQEADYGKGVS